MKSFPKVTARDPQIFHDQADLLSELEAGKLYCCVSGLSYVDILQGVNPVVENWPWHTVWHPQISSWRLQVISVPVFCTPGLADLISPSSDSFEHFFKAKSSTVVRAVAHLIHVACSFSPVLNVVFILRRWGLEEKRVNHGRVWLPMEEVCTHCSLYIMTGLFLL